MLLNDGSTEIEPQPCSADLGGPRIACPLEATEDAGLLIRGNADTLIADTHDCFTGVL